MAAVETAPAGAWAERTACPLCGGARHRVEHDLGSIPVVSCDDCGMRFAGRVLAAAALARYYGQDFGGERQRDGQRTNARVNVRAVERLLGAFRPRTALDIGSGYGFLVRELRARGIDARGLEPSARAAAEANARGAPTTHAVLAPDLELGRFDLVTSFEVIEHLVEPRAFLAEAARHVAPGGRLVVMTDNFDARVVRRMGEAFPKWIPHAHVSHFGAATFQRMCGELAGFRPEGVVSFTPWELSLVAWRHRLGARARPYDADAVMASEMSARYRWPVLRRALDPVWFRVAARADLAGELMYLALRPEPPAEPC